MRSVARSKFRRTFFVGKVIIYTSIFFVIGVVALLFIGSTEEVVIARGVVKPRFDFEVHAPEVGVVGPLKMRGSQPAKPGEYVRAGDSVNVNEIILQMDDKKLQDELVRKRSQITEAEGLLEVLKRKTARLRKDPAQSDQYRFAKNDLEVAQKEVEAEQREVARMESLVKNGVASQAELDKEKVKLEQAMGRLKTAQEKVKIFELGLSQDMLGEMQAETDLQEKRLASLREECKTVETSIERYCIRAPVAGEVVFHAKKPGEAVTPGELLFIIAKGPDTEIHAYVEENQIYKVGLGQRVHIYPTAFDWRQYGEAKGTVTDISPYAKEVGGSNQFWVRIVVEEWPLPLKFGSSVTAHIVVSRRGLLDMLLTR